MDWSTYTPPQNHNDQDKRPKLKYGQTSTATLRHQIDGDPSHPDVYVKTIAPPVKPLSLDVPSLARNKNK